MCVCVQCAVGYMGLFGLVSWEISTPVSCTNMYPFRNRKCYADQRRPREMMNLDGMYKQTQLGAGNVVSGFFFGTDVDVFLARDCLFDRLIIETGCWETHVAN